MLLGAIGPALTFLGVSAYWERAIQGAIILAAVAHRCGARRPGPRASPAALAGAGMSDARSQRRAIDRTANAVLAPRAGLEIALFALIAPQFFTLGQLVRDTRLSVELGLLAVALTPIIVTGGIDLSVGSMIGLSAVMFGAAYRDWQLPCRSPRWWRSGRLRRRRAQRAPDRRAATCRRSSSRSASFSLFRGIAEGITQRRGQLHGFPALASCSSARDISGGVVPAQLPIFARDRWSATCVLLHRSVIGRALYAIGFTPAGARYAGIPVRAAPGLVYLLSGLAAGVAAIIYVAHLGQARSDAGTGYELAAITAVVLGGTSVFGGRGTLWGTVLGLFASRCCRTACSSPRCRRSWPAS